MKLDAVWNAGKSLMSHPVRVRGLKQMQLAAETGGEQVAPRAGAWVETMSFAKMQGHA